MQHVFAAFEVFVVFLRLGLTSFGGPIAHVGYFHETFVQRKKWLSESEFAQWLALCQVLPGPTSSQMGMAIGLQRCGIWGASAAWLGFTLPSAALMFLLALGVPLLWGVSQTHVLRGLQWAALAVVAQAVLQMGRSLCPDVLRRVLALLALLILTGVPLLVPGMNHLVLQLAVVLLGGVSGVLFLQKRVGEIAPANPRTPLPNRVRSGVLLGCFCALLILLPLAAELSASPTLNLFDHFYRTGALVFGGGHVVLPLLASEFHNMPGVAPEVLLAGYGAAQALPGPLFSFAAFLGALQMTSTGAQFIGALISLVAVFLPSFFLIFALAPWWNQWREFPRVRAVLLGVNAAVVGLLASVLLVPHSLGVQVTAASVAAVAALFSLLHFARWPSWLVVLCGAGLSVLL